MDSKAVNRGMLLGAIGVLSFSLTLPMTRLAVAALDPAFVGFGRALVAGLVGAAILLATRQPRPTPHQWRRLAIVAAGVVFGFPSLSSWAMSRLPAAHGAIVLGLLPLATALAGAIITGERPTRGFWLASLAGSAVVLVFAVSQGAGQLQLPDVALLLAVALAAVGYAEGGRLSREIGGWQVICWALLLSMPLLLLPVLLSISQHSLNVPASAWLGFAYVSLISQLFGFFAWYRGLALGGVVRVSQLQLLQPFLTVVFAAVILGEALTLPSLIAACLVVATIALGRRAGVRPARQEASTSGKPV